MANVIFYKPVRPENSPQCGPHGYDQEAIYLDETLRSIDPNQDGTLKRTETKLTEDQFEKLAEKVQAFKRMKGDCSVLEGHKVNYLHQSRLEVVKYLGEMGIKISCQDDGHKCVKGEISTPSSKQESGATGRKLQAMLRRYANDSKIEETYKNNPEKYRELTDVEEEVNKFLKGKEKNPDVAKSKIVTWLKNDQLRNDSVSIFLRLKLREALKTSEYRDQEHQKGGVQIFNTLGAYYGKRKPRAVEASNVVSTGVKSLDDFDFIQKFPTSRKSVRVDTLDHFAKTHRGLVEENIVLPPKISEMTLSVYIKIDSITGNIIHVGFKNIRVIGEVSKAQKKIFSLQFIELAEKMLEAYRFYPGQNGEAQHQIRLVK